MTNMSRQPLAELERITRIMLEQARYEAWEEVEALEQARQSWLDGDYLQEYSTDDYPQLQARLQRIIEWDSQIMALARARQEELSELLGQLKQGRKAKRAYQNHILPD
jgi:hypothetical protein